MVTSGLLKQIDVKRQGIGSVGVGTLTGDLFRVLPYC
jgi:hypothetical protein